MLQEQRLHGGREVLKVEVRRDASIARQDEESLVQCEELNPILQRLPPLTLKLTTLRKRRLKSVSGVTAVEVLS